MTCVTRSALDLAADQRSRRSADAPMLKIKPICAALAPSCFRSRSDQRRRRAHQVSAYRLALIPDQLQAAGKQCLPLAGLSDSIRSALRLSGWLLEYCGARTVAVTAFALWALRWLSARP